MSEKKMVLFNDLLTFMKEPVVEWLTVEISKHYDEDLALDATNIDALLMIWSYAHRIEDFVP